jgi:hypothetical protein
LAAPPGRRTIRAMARTLGGLGLASLALAACTSTDPGGGEEPAPLTHRFGPYALAAGEEQYDKCVSWTLGNDEPVFANQVGLATGSGFHHSNWFWVPDTAYAGDDGTWRCSDRGYDEALAAAMGGVLFAQSTQSVSETQAFPPGDVIAIPPHSKIVAGVHLLNASDEPLDTYLDLTLTPIKREDVAVQLAALSLTYEALELPPGRTSSFTVECDLGAKFADVVGRPLDMNLYYVLPHYHALGRSVELVAGGPAGDRTIFSTHSAIGEPLGGALTPAFSMTGTQTLRFSCTFQNPRTTTVRWGLGDGEMCVVLAFTDSQFNWGGGVLDRMPGTPVDDGTTVAYQRECTLVAIPAHTL